MLDKRNYELGYVRSLQEKYKKDPALLERVLYAFSLLEALKISGLPFVFKGGTCLMLLLEHPMRLSTDIDIIVEPGTDVDSYIQKAGTIFPFVTCEEQIRVGRNSIEKRHFKFIYQSPLQKKEFYIILDILFSKIPYVETIEKEVKNELLLVEGTETKVIVPSADCILGDKLTAFAPYTTGIPLGVGKSMEIAKQLFDVATLIDVMEKQDVVKRTYYKVVAEEIEYRGLTIGRNEVLQDTINACLSIISRGVVQKEDYKEYIKGIKAVGTHILFLDYSGEIAAHQACKVLYLVTCLLKEKVFIKIEHPEIYIEQKIDQKKYKGLSSIKKQKLEAYGYLVEAIRLLEDE
ncbi:MAG: nucleotidyl transferase AbiEii/AbiGii toxin family protein [Lachnospiraceae bacterium]|nr:nucleotidyl transferase AbiEii/AbiGii toxin family protein [Lachnospiraceae bacterium]